MTAKQSPPAVAFTAQCLALFAFRGFAAGAVLMAGVWIASVFYRPPWWGGLALGTVATLVAARVCDWLAAWHGREPGHNSHDPDAP